MATGDYCELADVREHVGIGDSDTTRDLLILSLITSVSRAIDRECRRQFYATAETRYFDFKDAYQLWLDKDLISLTTLTNGDGNTLTAGTDFYLWPYSGPPYRRLDIARDVGNVFQWSGSAQRAISIAGSWGYASTTPESVKRACILWVADYVSRQGDEGVSEFTINDGGTMRVKYMEQIAAAPPPTVDMLIRPFKFVEVMA